MYNDIKAKQARRRAERRKRKSDLVVHIEAYKQARNNVTAAVKRAKACYFRAILKEAISDPKKMSSITNTLLNRHGRSVSLPDMDAEQVARPFSDFFSQKIEKNRESFVDAT